MDPVVNQLHDVVDSFKRAEDLPLEAAKRTARSISSIKLRIDSSRKLLNLRLIWFEMRKRMKRYYHPSPR